jgi:hypothetical protein
MTITTHGSYLSFHSLILVANSKLTFLQEELYNTSDTGMAAGSAGKMYMLPGYQTVCAVKAASPDLHNFHAQDQLGSRSSLVQGHAKI